MSPVKSSITHPTRPFTRPAVLLFIGVSLLLAQAGGQAQAPARPPLKLFKNFFLSGGDYVVGGVGLRGLGDTTTHLATGTIQLQGVPDNGDISAAFLYWASLEHNDSAPMSADGYFNGSEIHGKVIGPNVRVPGCWGSGGGAGTSSLSTQLRVYRADVLRYLPVSTEPATLGKLIVNGVHEVKLSDSGGGGTQAPSSGNQVRYVEGASLVVVYRVPVPNAPLRAVVIYDGGVTVDQDFPSMNLNIGGYYDASASPAAKMTHLVGNGDIWPDTLTINGTVVGGSNPFAGTLGSAWDNPTYGVPGSVSDTGVSTGVTFPSSAIDCLSWTGVVFSTDVQDTDGDGLPDRVEDGSAVVPDGEPPLPDFPRMGASKTVPDLFVELGFFRTSGWPSPSTVGPHDHRPTANALAMAGRAFKRAGINAHFDVGLDNAGDNRYPEPVSPYSSGCANLTTWTLGCALVAAPDASGGEFVTEAACGGDPNAPCQFPDYPGTVGWKSGYQYFRDAPVAPDGAQLSAAQEAAWEESCELSGACPPRRRFDANRRDFFHYSLWAHALGLPREPCLNADGSPNLTCQQNNVDFRVPGRSSGFGDVGGGDSLITLHAFGFNYNGADVTQAGTFMHEVGHNFERRHGGETLERNCKPNYVSVMSYLFQVHGMNGGAEVDFSGQVLNPLDEKELSDAALTVQDAAGTLPAYPTRWYAPLATSFIQGSLNVTPATKHCDGSPSLPTDVPMVRLDGTSATAPIDWLNDGVVGGPVSDQDINFDGLLTPVSTTSAAPNGPLLGSNDWLYIRQHGLRQVGSRPNMGVFSLDMSAEDLGRGDPGRGDPGRGDPGRGDPGRGDPGRGDPGRGDPGRGDPGRGDPGAPPDQGDLTLENANAIFNGPRSLAALKVGKTVELKWAPAHLMLPNVQVVTTTAYRVVGGGITSANWANRVLVGQASGAATLIVDTKPLNGKLVTYIVFVDFSDATRSGISNPATITY